MPKMKTHSGAKKRFKLTGRKKVVARHAMMTHMLGKKSAHRRRRLRKPLVLSGHDAPRAKELLRK